MSVVGSAEKELYRLHVHSDFTRWYEDCRPILDDMARIGEVTVLELLPTVLDDTLCMVLCEWKTDFLFGTIEDTLGYLEEWMLGATVDSTLRGRCQRVPKGKFKARAAVIDDGGNVTSSLNSYGDDGMSGQILSQDYDYVRDRDVTNHSMSRDTSGYGQPASMGFVGSLPAVDSSSGVTSDVMVQSLPIAQPSCVNVPKMARSSHVTSGYRNASFAPNQKRKRRCPTASIGKLQERPLPWRGRHWERQVWMCAAWHRLPP